MGYKNLFVLYHLGRFQLLPVPIFFIMQKQIEETWEAHLVNHSYSIVDTCYINSNLGSKSLELPWKDFKHQFSSFG